MTSIFKYCWVTISAWEHTSLCCFYEYLRERNTDVISVCIALKRSFKYMFSVKSLQYYSYKGNNAQYI